MRLPQYCLAIFITSILIPSCKSRHEVDAEKIETLRVRAEELIKAQSLMGWNSWVLGEQSNQDSLYKANADLFTKENIALARRAEGEEPDTVQKQRLLFLRRYLTSEYVGKTVAPLTDKVSNMEAAARITFEGKEIGYYEVNTIMANEPDRQRRARLYAALDPILDSLNVIHKEIEQVNQRLAKDLGYPDYTAMAEDIKGFSLKECRELSEEILAFTHSSYTKLLKEMLAGQLKMAPENFFRADVAALLRNKQFDKYFPESSMIDAVKKTYAGLGVDIDRQKNLTIDSDKRPTKNPRAVCYAIDIPSDVRLSIKPIGGYDDYSALFHEMGHGQHYANTKENALEFKYMGEWTVTENYAFLSQYLLANQAWLRLHTTMPIPALKDFVRFQAFYRLYFVRRYAAKVLYELELHSGVNSPQTRYVELQSAAIGFNTLPSDEKRYLADIDALYYSASYLRAWLLEAQLNAALIKEFGVNWFENPRAGERLRSLWAKGDRLNGDELATLIGYDGIHPNALMDEVRSMMLFSTK